MAHEVLSMVHSMLYGLWNMLFRAQDQRVWITLLVSSVTERTRYAIKQVE